MMLRYKYSHNYSPPAPIVKLALVNANEMVRTGTLVALLDTGADKTLVPIDHLESIAAPATANRFISTPWGDRHSVTLYLVDIQIDDLTLPGIEVIGMSG